MQSADEDLPIIAISRLHIGLVGMGLYTVTDVRIIIVTSTEQLTHQNPMT